MNMHKLSWFICYIYTLMMSSSLPQELYAHNGWQETLKYGIEKSTYPIDVCGSIQYQKTE